MVSSHKLTRVLVAFSMALSILAIPNLMADDHVVKRSELHQSLVSVSQAREKNLDQVRKFFSSEPAATALKTARVDSAKVKGAIAFLTDEELARLAARAEKIRNDFAAGALNNQELTYIVIALATAVLILVIVAA